MTGADVVAAARMHLNTPWAHQGRTPGVALDCAGLVICVARQLGLVASDMDVNGYSRAADGSLPDWCDLHMQRVAGPELGGVLVLVCDRQPQHLGIVGDYRHGGWSIIHATNVSGRVVETRLMFARNLRLVAAYRMPGVLGAD